MKILRAFVLSVAALTALAAQAQWQWIDKDGRKTFSDQPPPIGTPADKILKQPGRRADAPLPASAVDAAAPAASSAGGNTLRLSGKDRQLEEKKKQAEAAEAEKNKLEQEKQAKVKAENCERAKLGKAGLDSGSRMARTNAQGEREYMDDEARAAESRRMQAIINSECQ